MKINSLFFLLIISIVLSSCSLSKNISTRNLESIRPYVECDEHVQLNDIENEEINLLKNLKDLSYSTAYTSIYTPYHIRTDSIQKDSIRYLYSKKINKLIKIAFPKAEITNDSSILNKSYQYIARNSNRLHLKESIKNLTTNTFNSEKQLFINITSFVWKDSLYVYIRFYIFNLKNFIVLYKDSMRYDCDIRDYEALEKVISFGLLKLKENFE